LIGGLNWLNHQEYNAFQSETEKRRFYNELGALTGNNYKILNRVLWGDTGYDEYDDIEDVMEQNNILNVGISSFFIPENIVVYRAIRFKYF